MTKSNDRPGTSGAIRLTAAAFAAVFAAFILSPGVVVASGSPRSPNVSEVHFIMEHGKVYVTYNLSGDPDSKYEVKLILRNGIDTAYKYEPRAVAGDVGVGRYAGVGKKIVWSMDEEFPQGLPGSSYYFVVQAREIGGNSGTSLFTVLGTGVAVLAAAATYFLISGSHSHAQSATSLPPPPGRP